MTRTEARELLMQLFFQMEIQNDYSTSTADRYLTDHFEEGGQVQYARELCMTVLSHLEEIDHTINVYNTGWGTKRMPKVDLAVIRLALAEVLYMDSIPDPVAINEAVDMAKKYSTEDSRKYINGILGQVVKRKDEA